MIAHGLILAVTLGACSGVVLAALAAVDAVIDAFSRSLRRTARVIASRAPADRACAAGLSVTPAPRAGRARHHGGGL